MRRLPAFAVIFALALALILSLPLAASALSLGFDDQDSTVFLGGSVTVDLIISGLADIGSPTVGGFDIDVGFDSSIVGLTDWTFGPFLGDPDILAGETIALGIPLGSSINLFELSLLSTSELEGLQPDDEFVLASLTFQGLSVGMSDLDIPSSIVSSGAGLEILPPMPGGSITVIDRNGTAPIPEPSTIFLLGTGLIGIAGLRRKLS